MNKYFQKLWLNFIVIAVVSALLLGITSTAFSIYIYGNESNNIKAEAAIVLGAAAWGEEPSPVFRERINHAVNLYKNGDVRKIIFTGGVGESNELSEAMVGKRYAVKQAVKETDIFVETESKTTRKNLINARKVAVENKLSKGKFLIVSDPLHLKRAVLMAQDLGMDVYPAPTPTTRYRSFKSQFQFLMRETYFYFIYSLFKI
ncbi:MAG: YdcF family protein [Richelia sp. RM2_1_2]|nr:YdcF family protein [Richelia sp. SM2_1_7]NJM22105.1 YdcF family protein [Richelia sp. SM1_7_0]NJN12620.1 YdcF family protein [Richelia sp. RM1_1_1]NJO27759.1 YdcF family protein [Richelia sp. SL_2_1]NJO61857.1 YdcF family protein [Richelia sp. RM2_1_2]